MKKLLNGLVIVILLVIFGYGCFYIFDDEKVLTGKIINVKDNYIILEDNSRYNINKDTKFMLFNDVLDDVDYFNNNFLAYNAEITIKGEDVTKINLVTESNKMSIVAFFKKDVEEDSKEPIIETVKIVNHVLSVKYVSSEEAKEDMSERSQLLKDYLDNHDNPLLSYLVIEVDGNINQIVRYLNNLNEVESVRY